MKNEYKIKVSCGVSLIPKLRESVNKQITIIGNISLANIENITSNNAISAHNEKLSNQFEQSTIMKDCIANAFIYHFNDLTSGILPNIEGKEITIEKFDYDRLKSISTPIL